MLELENKTQLFRSHASNTNHDPHFASSYSHTTRYLLLSTLPLPRPPP